MDVQYLVIAYAINIAVMFCSYFFANTNYRRRSPLIEKIVVSVVWPLVVVATILDRRYGNPSDE